MAKTLNATGERIAGPESPPGESALLDVGEVADELHCSPRHVYRLVDFGAMPRPLRLGSLVRWRRDEISNWISAGCPAIPVSKGGPR